MSGDGAAAQWGEFMKKRLVGWFGVIAALMLFAAACAPNPDGMPEDAEAPQLISLDVIPSEVIPGQPVTITATVSDNIGVSNVAFLVGRNGTPSGFCSGDATLVTGSATFGTWRLSCTAPAALNAGVYEVGVLAVDARLNNAVGSASFTVAGNLNDNEAPVVQSVTTSPSVVPRGSQITISAHVTDATGALAVGFAVRHNKTDTMGWCFEGAVLKSGSATDGIWEVTCTVDGDTTPGQYRINTAVSDLLGNIGGVTDDGADAVSGPFTVTSPAG